MQYRDAIKAIKEKLSLADFARRYLDLRANGGRLTAPCPFHQETKPSFYIFPEQDSFYCFGCQASGDIIEFYSRIAGLDFHDALTDLAEEAGVSLESGPGPNFKAERSEKQQMLAMHQLAGSHFRGRLATEEGSKCRAYVEKRGISPAILERFELGWAPRSWDSLKNCLSRNGMDLNLAATAGLLGRSDGGRVYDRFRGRLIFPIKSLSGQIIAFGGRIIADEDEAKYINSAETPIYSKKEHLFGLAQARRAISAQGHVFLTEGYMDVLTLHQFGYENSVGVLGTALTTEQIKRLAGFTSSVMLLFDGDRAGRKAALRAAEMFLGCGLACRVILLPEPEDIDSLLRNYGRDAFDGLRDKAPDGLTFCIETARSFAPIDTINWARNFLANMQAPELVSHFAQTIAHKLGFEEQDLRSDARQKAHPARACPEADYRSLCERDTQIMVFAARYPDKLNELRELGADAALTTERAKKLWQLIETHGPETVVYHLDEKQKRFWMSQAGPQAPPRTTCEMELACLKEGLDRFYAQSQMRALRQTFASAANSDFGSELEFLHALRDTMRKTDEQS